VFQSLIVALVLSRLDYCNSVLFGLPANLIQRLQSVQNAAARLIFSIRRSEHITPALISVHWLRVSERISFKLAVLTYRSIHGTSVVFHSCRRHDIKTTAAVFCLSSSRSTARSSLYVSKRAFPVSGANMWNDLPFHFTSTQSLAVFRQRLKTFFFSRSYPDILI